MDKPIETAADLHRELTKRGLELRPDVGRDVALVADLADRLGIEQTRIISGLKSSGKTAEDYLRAFMLVAKPFALMFREVWAYLARHCAPKAGESLVIRFGFSGDQEEFDWNQFRIMAETTKQIQTFGPVLLWPQEELFALAAILHAHSDSSMRHLSYRPGKSVELGNIEVLESADRIVSQARDVVQSLIDDIHLEWPSLETDSGKREDVNTANPRGLPELRASERSEDRQSPPPNLSTLDLARVLTDLVPIWDRILYQWKSIPTAAKQEAERYFHETVEPVLKSDQSVASRRVKEALDLLDMPFWRHRWHTYEVWATVKALEALQEFQPQPVVKDGRIALDASAPSLVAKLSSQQPIYAHIQGETKLAQPLGNRKAIRPDLRFSLDDPASNASTVAIVEYKQRHQLDAAHLSEVLTAYSMGVGLGGGVVLVNYDAVPTVSVPANCVVVGNVNPGHPENVIDYQAAIRKSFRQASIEPLRITRCVLLDVSSSMNTLYNREDAQRGLRRLLALPWVKVFRFNDGLVTGADLPSETSIATQGGTQLGASLQQLFSMPDVGIPDQLIVVTDGGHDHPKELINKCGKYIECTPEALESHLDWFNEY